MADNKSGSQESLPLSQETYLQLFKELDGSLSRLIQDEDLEPPLMSDQACSALINEINSRGFHADTPMINGHSDVHHQQITQNGVNLHEKVEANEELNGWHPVRNHISEIKRPISSLPASENWPGAFSFTISFHPQTVTKGVSWIFSKERKKLYVGKDVPCPVNVSTNALMPEEVFIRAMALFSSSDHASEKVTRCVNHSVEELTRNVYEAEHFIRCESQNAHYEIDPVTGRHSVIVPYENPPVGQKYSTYLYKFMCFGSCSGGPNRRAIMVVFTLERRGEVLGRQKIDLKVCACPMRDFKADEKQSQTQGSVLKENKPVNKRPREELLSMEPIKKVKQESCEEYCVKTSDRNCYLFLRKMKRLYDIHSNLNNKYPSLKRLLYNSSQSSSGGEET